MDFTARPLFGLALTRTLELTILSFSSPSIPTRRRISAFLSALLLCVAAQGQDKYGSPDISFKQLLTNPRATVANIEFRAYITGIGRTILKNHVCSEADEVTLRDPSKMIEALMNFPSRAEGKLYVEDVVLWNISYQRQSGDVLYELFTKHRECKRISTN